MARIPRGIRLDDDEWEDFKALLGAEWLRKQIVRARKREDRQPIAVPDRGKDQ